MHSSTVMRMALAGLIGLAGVGATGMARAGDYDVVTKYAGAIEDTRGWTIDWSLPPVLNAGEAAGAIGEWYFNLESGAYFSGGQWWVYWYGADNGNVVTSPNCFQMWDTGGFCRSPSGGPHVGDELTFKYEWCTPAHAPDVNGSRVCLSVDYHDGLGYQFLASDVRTTVEMYTHDMESFDDAMVRVSCASPTIMRGQTLKRTDGTWHPMTGASTFVESVDWQHHYFYENANYSASPATWKSCSSELASLQTINDWGTGYCANIVVTNQSALPFQNWSVDLDLQGTTITQLWNGTSSTANGPLTISPVAWNQVIPRNQTNNSIGFCASRPASITGSAKVAAARFTP